MKLVGIEIKNYACFERQYLPLRQGINLLVGKNNAGKTSLLKAIAALSAVPLQQRPYTSEDTRNFINDLVGYLPNAGQKNHFQVDVVFQFETGDPLPIAGDQQVGNEFIETRKPIAIYTFCIMPQNSEAQALFQCAKLQVDGSAPLEFLSSENEGLLFHAFEHKNGSFSELRNATLNRSGRTVMGPDNKTHWLPLPETDHFRVLIPMLNNRYIATHRVVAPWMGIQTAERLPENAENLSVFLQTLRGNRPRAYHRIESVVRHIFPEIAFVNPATQANRVQISLSQEGTDRDIPLTHSGAGIEQILAIVTFAATAEPGAILLLDEPHSFLHPSAERQLMQFLGEDRDHTYIIATHSAVIINSVEAERITYVEGPGSPRLDRNSSADGIGRILLDLGYRNSDILFHDQLLVVEGRSDAVILPLLLEAAGVDRALIARTGYPTMEGVPGDVRSLQAAVHRHERILNTISPVTQTRMYLFDGDRTKQECDQLLAMRDASGRSSIPVRFLPRTEIENYLLDPKAISRGLQEEAQLAGVNISANEKTVRTKMYELLEQHNDAKLYPRGPCKDPLQAVKGSVVLERLYANFENLVYHKHRSGPLIARHMVAKDNPLLAEIVDVLRDFFTKPKASGAAAT